MGNVRCRLDIPRDVIISEMKECVGRYVKEFALTEPATKQNSMSSHALPGIVYIESIFDGNVAHTVFDEPIHGENVMRGGIEKILEFAGSTRLRSGDVHRYVILYDAYADYEQAFADAGVTVLHSLEELQEAINNEVERLAV